jgi:pyruvate,water dikinase
MSDPQVFNLELETIKLIRNKYGFKNLWLMLPFVRTVHELVEVKKIIAASGLLRSPSFKLWMMVEIPSNVIILDQFCQAGIDGVSIGSNDLTMLILGTDRDNTEVAPEFDERNEAVLWAIERVIATCHKYGVTSSICGQAPSDYPELVEKLISWGITSVSVNPDALAHVKDTIYAAEQKLIKKK